MTDARLPGGPAPEHLRWKVSAEARPGPAGVANVTVRARNPLVPELVLSMEVDWAPGAEAQDVEGRALVILSLLCKQLSAECDRIAGERFAG